MNIAITGLGVVSCAGNGVADFWSNVTNGVSGIKTLPENYYSVAKTKQTGFVPDFELSSTFDRRWINKTDRHLQLALNATEEAVKQSGLNFSQLDPSRIQTILGTCAGSYEFITSNIKELNDGYPAMPNFIPGHINNMMSAYINMHYGIQGAGLCLTGACAAGNQAAAIAAMMIETGQADVVITGASDSWLSEVVVSGFESLGALSFADVMPRPFDVNRNGFAISEGAGIMIFESVDHAAKRGANILAYLSGYAMSCDALHPTGPDPAGIAVLRMIVQALQKAELAADNIDYINAHSTGTPAGDKVECQTLAKLFDNKPYISATKSMTGHSIGSSSAIEAVISVMALQDNLVPGTINVDNLDPECPGNHVTKTINTPINHVLSNSFGFGGTNGVLIFSSTRH